MDEIQTKIYSGSVSYKENKIYFNYTDHLMNNTLRQSTMFMESDAKNLTVGLTGKFYELTFRNWQADNFMKMMSNSISNNQMPNVNQFSGVVTHSFDVMPIKLSIKGGAQYFVIGDEERISFYNLLYTDVNKNSFFVTAALNAHSIAEISNDFISTISAEVATEAPETEQLYIAIERMGTNPNWSGNPNLKQPIKLSLRTSFIYKFFNIEGFANHVSNYVNVVKKPITTIIRKNEVNRMKEIFEQYGSVIIAAVAISALVAIIVMLLATDGVVANSFKNLIDSFFNRAASTITG